MPDSGPPPPGTLLEVEIAKVVFGGDGLARAPEGFVIFVPFTAEGDRARVRVTERKASHARAELVELLSAGPNRETPPCPYYARCGGCRYQHVGYAEELRLKESQVREAFARTAKMTNVPVRPIIASPQPYHYRNRITVHAESGRVGFRSVNGRELVDIKACLLARDEVNAALEDLRSRGPADGHYSLRSPALPPSGFFQANHDLGGTLRDLVTSTMPEKGAVLLEGYCGGGFFTGPVAGRFKDVIAIDNDPRTLRDAARLRLENVSWQQGDAADALPEELRARRTGDVTVLVDPPREGLPVRLAEALCIDPVAHLTYVSCDPMTLARDARLLAKTYRLESVQPIDLFPRTAQIECITVWSRP
jgi:23S rRNA (uracil1939-C5)-methyltransferase